MPKINMQVWSIILFNRNESAILAQIHTKAAQVVCDSHCLRRYMMEIRRLSSNDENEITKFTQE
jgi:hypothetical protein